MNKRPKEGQLVFGRYTVRRNFHMVGKMRMIGGLCYIKEYPFTDDEIIPLTTLDHYLLVGAMHI